MYDADTVIVPVVLPEKLAEQVAAAPLPLSVQLVLVGATPAPLAVKFTVVVGILAVPGDVSLTVTVQLRLSPMPAGLTQLTDVDVARLFTVAEPLAGPLPLWAASPT